MSNTLHVIAWTAILLVVATFFLIWLKRGEPWSIANLFLSLLLICLAATILVNFPPILVSFEKMHTNGIVSNEVLRSIQSSGALWLAVIPLLAGGVGINVFSNFLTSKKPT